jgi:hypothetical protein
VLEGVMLTLPDCLGCSGATKLCDSAITTQPKGSTRRNFFKSNGFTQVPLRLTSDNHLEVVCSIDGVPSTILVDTGSQFTFVDESIGTKAEP